MGRCFETCLVRRKMICEARLMLRGTSEEAGSLEELFLELNELG